MQEFDLTSADDAQVAELATLNRKDTKDTAATIGIIMTTGEGKLSSPQLVNQLNAVVDAKTVVSYYCKSVIKQEDIKLAALENLPAHQNIARKHAQRWLESVEPGIQQCFTDTMNFSRAFLGKYSHLNLLIDQMKNGNQQAKDEFTTTVRNLTVQLGAVVDHSKDITTEAGQFCEVLNQDTRNFKSDSEEAQIKITGDNGDLKALQDQLEGINKAIDRDIGLTAGGVFLVWLAVAGGVDLKKQKDAKHDVELRMAMKRQELRALNAAKSHIDGFVGSLAQVSSALTSLEGAWASLKSDFEEVATELKSLSTTSAAVYLGPLLETAKKDWDVAFDRAKQLQGKTEQF